MPLRATPPLPFTADDPTETAFSTKKEKSGGGNLKNAKAFSGGAQRADLPARRRGLASHLALEIGSNFVVKSHQEATIFGKVAHSGGFFAGGAQRLPVGFQGGDLKLPPRQVGVLFCFLAAKAAPLRGKI